MGPDVESKYAQVWWFFLTWHDEITKGAIYLYIQLSLKYVLSYSACAFLKCFQSHLFLWSPGRRKTVSKSLWIQWWARVVSCAHWWKTWRASIPTLTQQSVALNFCGSCGVPFCTTVWDPQNTTCPPARSHTSPLPRSVQQLKTQITNLDQEFDKCQEVWTRGEAEGFFTEKFLIYNTFLQTWMWTCAIQSQFLCMSYTYRSPLIWWYIILHIFWSTNLSNVQPKVLQWCWENDESCHTCVGNPSGAERARFLSLIPFGVHIKLSDEILAPPNPISSYQFFPSNRLICAQVLKGSGCRDEDEAKPYLGQNQHFWLSYICMSCYWSQP